MFVSLRKILKILKPQHMKDWLGRFSIINQFAIIFLGFTGLIIVLAIFGWILMISMNLTIGYGNIRLNKELGAFARLKVQLAEIQVLGNENYSQISNRSSAELLNEIKLGFHDIKPYLAGENFRVISKDLIKLSGALSGTVSYQKYQMIRDETWRLRSLLSKHEQSIRHLRAGKNNFSLSITLLILLMVFVAAGFIYWIKVTVMLTTEYQSVLRYFENIALKYRRGHLVQEINAPPVAEFANLTTVLQNHFEQMRERCQELRTYVTELQLVLDELELSINRNDEHCLNVKEALRTIINDSYHRLDFFPEMAEQITKLNLSLSESQQESIILHQAVETAGENFQKAPLNIENITVEIDAHDKHTSEINLRLKEIRKALDNIQQIVTIFDSIAQQTTVLALNASIEAARAGAIGSGFDIAATEIDLLADKIGIIPQELVKTMSRVQKQILDTARVNELVIPQHRLNKKFFEVIIQDLNDFWQELAGILKELREFNNLAYQFETREKSLEQVTILLADLNKQIPVNYGKVIAILDVVGESEQLPVSITQIMQLIDSFNQKLDEIFS